MDGKVQALRGGARFTWDWARAGSVKETSPKSIEIDIPIESSDPGGPAAIADFGGPKGLFFELTLTRPNTVRHRLTTPEGPMDL